MSGLWLRLLATGLLALACHTSDSEPSAATPLGMENPREAPAAHLVTELDSEDGPRRAAATAELLRRGSAALAALEAAGARPIRGLDPSRRDVVYSLIRGLEPGAYRPRSFGLHLAPGVTRHDVLRMAQRHGFLLPESERVLPGRSPACYVELTEGRGLGEVLESVLSIEPAVETVNLSYLER